MKPLLAFDRIGLRAGTSAELLRDVSVTLFPGDVVTVAGPAGAGKTLLVEVAALARRPSRGDLWLFGREATAGDGSERAAARRRIGWIEAEPTGLPGLTAIDGAALPLRLAGVSRAEARGRAAEMLQWLGLEAVGLVPAAESRRHVAIARAVLAGQELVLLDELAGLPPPLLDRMMALVARLSGQGTAFLLTGRDDALLARVPGGRPMRMWDGQLEAIDRRGPGPLQARR